jgi:hypothetical protein
MATPYLTKSLHITLRTYYENKPSAHQQLHKQTVPSSSCRNIILNTGPQGNWKRIEIEELAATE